MLGAGPPSSSQELAACLALGAALKRLLPCLVGRSAKQREGPSRPARNPCLVLGRAGNLWLCLVCRESSPSPAILVKACRPRAQCEHAGRCTRPTPCHSRLAASTCAGRVLNISVTCADGCEPPRLLNYLTGSWCGRLRGEARGWRPAGWAVVQWTVDGGWIPSFLSEPLLAELGAAPLLPASQLLNGNFIASQILRAAPHVVIWSAVACSSSLTGLVAPQELLTRNAAGQLVK